MVKNKELAVGSIVTFANGDKVKVVEKNSCNECYFGGSVACTFGNNEAVRKIIGNCAAAKRKDNKNIVFMPFTGGLEETVTDEGGHGTDTHDVGININKDNMSVIPLYKNNNELLPININTPKEYVIDIDNSDFVKGIIKFKKKYITLADVYNKLIDTNVVGYAENIETPDKAMEEENFNKYNFMICFANLLDIAQYYNDGWNANFEEFGTRYFIRFDTASNHFSIGHCMQTNSHYVYFKNKEDCQAVIDNPNFKEILNTLYGSEN